jgi:Inner membrane protein YgaP-like, transmembrane domain
MKRNMSNIDRIIRSVIALVFAYLYFAGIVTGAFGIVLLVVAVVFLFTAIFAFCPIYYVLKLSTLKA